MLVENWDVSELIHNVLFVLGSLDSQGQHDMWHPNCDGHIVLYIKRNFLCNIHGKRNVGSTLLCILHSKYSFKYLLGRIGRRDFPPPTFSESAPYLHLGAGDSGKCSWSWTQGCLSWDLCKWYAQQLKQIVERVHLHMKVDHPWGRLEQLPWVEGCRATPPSASTVSHQRCCSPSFSLAACFLLFPFSNVRSMERAGPGWLAWCLVEEMELCTPPEGLDLECWES